MKFVHRRNIIRPTISMLNLIDVMFILVLFFMVTTTFSKFTQYNIRLPQAEQSMQDLDTNLVQLYYDKNGLINLEIGRDKKVSLSLDSLMALVESFSEKQKENIVLNADESISYGNLVSVISALKNAGVENIKLNIQIKE